MRAKTESMRPRTALARSLRRNSTEAEQLLWRALREAGFPWRIRRQHPIGTSIADFACPSRKLVIELDGGQHVDHVTADAKRTSELEHRGYRVTRFWNNEVLGNLDGVMEAIRCALEEG